MGNFAVPVYLNEVLGNSNFQLQRPYSEFNESILIASLCGEAISHRSHSLLEGSYCKEPERFFARHQQLLNRLAQYVEMFAMDDVAQPCDSTRLFLRIMWITVILYNHRTLKMVVMPMNCEDVATDCIQKASTAAEQLTGLMYRLLEFNGRQVSRFPPLICPHIALLAN